MGVKQKRKQYPEMAKKLAKGIRARDVLLEAGYSETQASKGWAAVPDGVKLLLPAKGKRLMNLGSVDPQTRRKLVRGRLLDNVIKGKDGGAMSAKILGSDSELNMWQPEFQQGIIVLGDFPRLPGMTAEEYKDAMLHAQEEP